MESQVIMNAFHHATWGEAIAIYFFLMGVSAGAHVISAFGWVFGIKRYKPIGLFANIFSIIVLFIIPPFLIQILLSIFPWILAWDIANGMGDCIPYTIYNIYGYLCMVYL